MPERLRGLYAITDTALQQGRLLVSTEAALLGGARIVQYRDKSADHARRHDEAGALRQLCHRHGALFLVNDDVALAHAVRADGVHLGQGDATLRVARAQLGAQAVIGITCHDSLALAQAAADGGADYLAFGAMFASTSKPQARTCPLPVLAEARRRFALPLVAIGGITPDNAGQVAAAGADALAVIAALWQAADIHAAAAALARTYSPAMSSTT